MTLIEALNNLELRTLVGQTPETLKATYFALANKLHPDKGGNTTHFVRVKQAYQALISELKKQESNAELDLIQAKLDSANTIIASYKKLFTQQINLIRDSGNSLDQIHRQYSIISDKLTETLQLELSKLDHRRNIPWWKIMTGVNPMTQAEYNQQYNQIISHYNTILDQANDKFVTELLETYKTINDQLIDILSKV